MKTCKACKEEKPLEQFYKVANSQTSRCRPCHLEYYHRKKYGTNGLDEYQRPDSFIKDTKIILQNLGYDTSKDVHKQFMVRFEKWLLSL